MQLQMNRSQKSGIFKTKYILTARLNLSDEEKSLLRQHKLHETILFDGEKGWGPPHIFQVTASGYITKGHDFTCSTANELAILENTLEENCRRLAGQLKNLRGAFDSGPRTVNFDED
jgi:hypothetical protein